MSWYYQGQPLETPPDGSLGFVYIITNLSNKKQYIGKKLFWFSKTSVKTVTLKNGTKKKKKIKTLVESDWKTYYGSNENLKKDVLELDNHLFERKILHIVSSKGMLSYLELVEQVTNKVLENPDKFYNRIIQCTIHGKHLKL